MRQLLKKPQSARGGEGRGGERRGEARRGEEKEKKIELMTVIKIRNKRTVER